MKLFEIWVIGKDNDRYRISIINAQDRLEAMKIHFRNCHAVFFYDNWNEQYGAYKYKEQYIFPLCVGEEDLDNLSQKIFKNLLMPKQKSTCDCGSEKIYGKTSAHSHWCSSWEA